MKLSSICQALQQIAPLALAESWDNVGLLAGDRESNVRRILTCLTITPAVVQEALEQPVELIVTHHPLPFQPLSKITTDSVTGQMLWRLIGSGVAVYSAHTAYDSASGGINEQWCERMSLSEPRPLVQTTADGLGTNLGSGRFGELPCAVSANDFLRKAAASVGATRPRLTGDPNRQVRRAAVACGSGGSFVGAARRHGCDLLLTGEATFHQCLEADNTGLTLAMVGHHASEWFAMETLADRLNETLGGLRKEGSSWRCEGSCRPSRADRDPIAVDPTSLNP